MRNFQLVLAAMLLVSDAGSSPAYRYTALGTNPDGNSVELQVVLSPDERMIVYSGEFERDVDFCIHDDDWVCIGGRLGFRVPRRETLAGAVWEDRGVEFEAGPAATYRIVGESLVLNRIVARRADGSTERVFWYSCREGLVAFAEGTDPHSYFLPLYVAEERPAFGAWC